MTEITRIAERDASTLSEPGGVCLRDAIAPSGSHVPATGSESADTAATIPCPMLSVEQIESKAAQALIVEHHYLHRKTGISHAIGLLDGAETVGVVTFGCPPSRHLQVSACKSNPELVVELNRLWVDDRMPRNTESWFLARALKLLPPLVVVSYADTKFDHYGHVYRASNFYYAGWTDMERKTPRYDYIPWEAGKHTRDAFRNGYAKRVRRLPKAKYWTVTGDRRERRRLLKLATWPLLDWKQLRMPGETYEQMEMTA